MGISAKPKFKALDPIGNNQNGDRYPFTTYALVGAGALGAALYACTRVSG